MLTWDIGEIKYNQKTHDLDDFLAFIYYNFVIVCMSKRADTFSLIARIVERTLKSFSVEG